MSSKCSICYDYIDDKYCLDCYDEFCKNCIQNYIENKIRDNDSKINCPIYSCEREIDYSTIKDLLWSSDFEKYEEMMLRHSILNSDDMSYCPHCDSVCIKYEHSSKSKCNDCQYKYCFLCKCVWSKDHECDNSVFDEIIENVKEALDEHDVKYCPKCKIIISRNGGCLAVECKNCYTKFCWGCLGTNHQVKKHGHSNDCNEGDYRFENNSSDSSNSDDSSSG